MNNAIGDTKMSEVELDINSSKTEVKIRTPKRIVHCSDGVYEEYSEDEDDAEQSLDINWLQMMTLDGKPDSMSWLWWSVYKGARALGHTLQSMNNWGEWFADEIGITRPVYQDLIDQHNELMEDAGIPVDEKDFEVVTNQPDN